MKKFILIFILLNLVSFSNEKLKIAINHAPPYRIIEGNTYKGFYIDLMKEVLTSINIEYEFIEVSFKRALLLMENGEVDMMLGPNKTKDREKYMKYLINSPLPKEKKVFYYLYKKNEIVKYEDLIGKTISVVRGSKYFDRFDEDKTLTLDINKDHLTCLKKVYFKRSDITILPEKQGDYLLLRNGIYLEKSKLEIEGKTSYIALSKKSKYLKDIKIFEEAINKFDLKKHDTLKYKKSLIPTKEHLEEKDEN